MKKFWRIDLALLALALMVVAATLAFPYAARALPGRVQERIPDRLWAFVETPLPAALPAAQVTAAPVQLDLLRETSSAVTPTPTPSPIASPAALTPNLTVQPTDAPTEAPTSTPSATATATMPPPPSSARIEGVRIIAQALNNCGPANLAMVVNFYGHAVSQAQIGTVLKPSESDANVNAWELAGYAAEQTPLQADYFVGGDLILLKRLVAAGFPVIVEKGYLPSARDGWMGHYLTLVAYDDGRQTFTGMDTYFGPWDSAGHPINYDDLAGYWEHFNYAFILAYPPERAEAARELLGPDMLDRERMWRQAGHLAQTAVAADPQNEFAWFNLGASLTQLGKLTGDDAYFTAAAAAFDQARAIGLPWRMLWYQFDIYDAYLANGRYDDVFTLANTTMSSSGNRAIEESHLYRGHAYLAQGNVAAARADYRRALELNPNFTLAREALAALADGD